MNDEILWVVGVESFHLREGIVIPSFLFLIPKGSLRERISWQISNMM